MAARGDQRKPDELRPVSFTLDFQVHPAGSVLVAFGRTRVICSVSVSDGVPSWMREQKVPGGWLTAEYGMLPGATHTRTEREAVRGRGGRTYEVQRLIGRALRMMVDLRLLGERTLRVDCDVLRADGGTRTAAITGAALALRDALRVLQAAGAFAAAATSKSLRKTTVSPCASPKLIRSRSNETSLKRSAGHGSGARENTVATPV